MFTGFNFNNLCCSGSINVPKTQQIIIPQKTKKKILWDKGYTTYGQNIIDERNGSFICYVTCHDVELECGHRAVYKHHGIIEDTMECEICNKKHQ